MLLADNFYTVVGVQKKTENEKTFAMQNSKIRGQTGYDSMKRKTQGQNIRERNGQFYDKHGNRVNKPTPEPLPKLLLGKQGVAAGMKHGPDPTKFAFQDKLVMPLG